MRSVYEIRRLNLRAIMGEWGGPTSLAKKLGHTNGSYLAQLIGPNPSRDISEKVAREIESKLNLPTNWLDGEHGQQRVVDNDVLVACVRAVSAATAGRTLSPDVMAEIVGMVYEQTKLTGRIDEPFINRLLRIVK
jgi:hypothetical protein